MAESIKPASLLYDNLRRFPSFRRGKFVADASGQQPFDWEFFSQGISAPASVWDVQEGSRPALDYRYAFRKSRSKQTKKHDFDINLRYKKELSKVYMKLKVI